MRFPAKLQGFSEKRCMIPGGGKFRKALWTHQIY